MAVELHKVTVDWTFGSALSWISKLEKHVDMFAHTLKLTRDVRVNHSDRAVLWLAMYQEVSRNGKMERGPFWFLCSSYKRQRRTVTSPGVFFQAAKLLWDDACGWLARTFWSFLHSRSCSEMTASFSCSRSSQSTREPFHSSFLKTIGKQFRAETCVNESFVYY